VTAVYEIETSKVEVVEVAFESAWVKVVIDFDAYVVILGREVEREIVDADNLVAHG